MTPIGSTSSKIRRAIEFMVDPSFYNLGAPRGRSRSVGRLRTAKLIAQRSRIAVWGTARNVPLGRGRADGTVLLRESLYSWSVSPGVSEKTLSAVRSGAPMWIAEAAIHRSLAWARSWSGMACTATGESKLGESREETIADGNDGGCLDRLIEAAAARVAPSGHEGAVSE